MALQARKVSEAFEKRPLGPSNMTDANADKNQPSSTSSSKTPAEVGGYLHNISFEKGTLFQFLDAD